MSNKQNQGLLSILVLGSGLFACVGGATRSTTSGGDNGSAGEGGASAGGGEGGTTDPGTGGSGDTTGGGQGGQANSGQAGTGGTAPGQGGSGTGGTAPAGGAGGVAAGPCSIYCDGFEALALNARPVPASVAGTSKMFVTDTKAFSGTKSLQIESSQATSNFSITPGITPGTGRLPDPKRKGYQRMMIWLDNIPAPSAADPGHFGLMSMNGSATNTDTGQSYQMTFRFGGFATGNSTLFYYGGGFDCTKYTNSLKVPLKKWACLELKVDEDDIISNYSVSVDGQEVDAISVIAEIAFTGCSGLPRTDIWYIPKPRSFTFGWDYAHTQGSAVRFWIDDLVIDQKPIGCPPGPPTKP